MAASVLPLVPALRPQVALELGPHGFQRGQEGIVAEPPSVQLILGDQAEHADGVQTGRHIHAS